MVKMNPEDLKQLAWHIAAHIGNTHHGYDFPSRADLADYIEGAIRTYEIEHIGQKIIIRRDG